MTFFNDHFKFFLVVLLKIFFKAIILIYGRYTYGYDNLRANIAVSFVRYLAIKIVPLTVSFFRPSKPAFKTVIHDKFEHPAPSCKISKAIWIDDVLRLLGAFLSNAYPVILL